MERRNQGLESFNIFSKSFQHQILKNPSKLPVYDFKPIKGHDFSLVDSLFSYGCWCQIRNQEVKGILAGHGAPVDRIDAACKAWHQCRKCTTADFSTDGATIGACVPNEVSANYNVGLNKITNRIDCQFNSDQCSVSKHCV